MTALSKPSESSSSIPAFIPFLVFVFLLPHKFANTVPILIYSFWPQHAVDWLFAAWPFEWAPILLVAAILWWLLKGGARQDEFHLDGHLLVCLVAIPVSLIGCIQAPPGTMPWRVVLHWSLLLPVAMICTISLRRHPKFESILCTVLAISIACLSFQVLFEYFITTPALISEYTQKIKQHPDAPDIRFWKEIVMRLRQQRPQANFSITNLLAGYYILVIPFLCAWIWKLARHVEPARISPWILTPPVGGILFFCLYVTQSRAAILSLFLAAGAGLFFCLVLRFGEMGRQEDRQRKRLLIRQLTFMMLTMFCLVIMMVALYAAVAGNRTLSSLWARFDYWSIAWNALIHAPLTGTGHGGFFPTYLQLRSPEMEIARLPHSLFYNLMASCGISGCLWFIAWAWVIFKTYATTLQAWLIEKRLPFFYPAAATGCVAWFLHAQLDMDAQAPAGILTMSILLSLVHTRAHIAVGDTTWWILSPRIRNLILAGSSILLLSAGIYLPGLWSWRKLENLLTSPELHSTQELLTTTTKAAVPGNPAPWLATGLYFMRVQNYSAAFQAYQAAVRIAPWYADAYLKLAEIELARNQFRNALKFLMQAVTLHPHSEKNLRLLHRIIEGRRNQKD